MAPLEEAVGERENGHPRLEPGARGLAVMDLKRRLRKWFELQGEPPPRRMRGPVYGTSAVEAVKRFQREAGLTANGVVGEETWRALPDN